MRSRIASVVVFLLSTATCGHGQDTTNIKGDCNPVIKGNTNTVSVVCTDRKQAEDLKRLIQKLLSTQTPPEVLMQHLDDIERGVAKCGERRLTPEQTSQFKEALGPVQETLFNIACDTRAPDSCAYAQDFVDAMTSSGWKVEIHMWTIAGGDVPTGITATINDIDAQEGKDRAAMQFVNAAHAIGVDIAKGKSGGIPRGTVSINFGRKE